MILYLLRRDSEENIRKQIKFRIKVNETKIQTNVTSTTAGDDGEAVAKKKEEIKIIEPNKGLNPPEDAGWYVAVVRVNCEEKIAKSIQSNLNRNDIWFEYWVPKIKVVCIDK